MQLDDKIKFFNLASLTALWDRIKEKFVPAGSDGMGNAEKEGLTKLYEETGTNTDGAMTQKAVTELFGNLKDAAGAAFRTVFTKI